MDYREYLARTSLSDGELLEDWRWLVGPRLQVWHITKAGDALLRDPADGSIHFLDVISGKVKRIAPDEAAFEAAVLAPENAERWLMPHIVDAQAAIGMRCRDNECLSFIHPPVLGGQLDPDNFETCHIAVHFSISGQLHRQVKDLPPGTKVTKIDIQESRGSIKRPWWKFW